MTRSNSIQKKKNKKKKKDRSTMKSIIDEAISERKQKKDSDEKNKPAVVPPKKLEKENLTLEKLKNDLCSAVYIIRHDGGIYYYNGRTYVAIKNDTELIELFCSEVRSDLYGAKSIKFINDLYIFMKADKNMIPEDYEKRLAKSRHLVALKNRLIDVKELKPKEFKPKHLLFFELDANWTTEKPHTFWKFLKESCGGDKQIIMRVLEVLGCIFSGNNDCKAFFVIGTARNIGKSTLTEFIKKS